MSGGPMLYPNVSTVPAKPAADRADRAARIDAGTKGEFDRVFQKTLGKSIDRDLSQAREPLKFSAHAMQRLQERKIELDPEAMGRVNDALDKAEAKGVEDSLILLNDAALIVSVKNRTVVTALDRKSLSGNVFTNIDGAVIV